MLEIARKKARREGYDIEFIECDARDLDRVFEPSSFDAVTMFFTSIAYMLEWEDLVRLLRSARYVLRSGGIFFADTSNPHYFMYNLGNLGQRRIITWTAKGPEGEILIMNDWKEIEDWAKPIILFKKRDSDYKAR